MRRAWVIALGLVLAAALGACSKSSADTFSGAQLHVPYHVPATQLVDTEGQPFSLKTSTHKRLTLIFFGYTHCPDECPATMATLASAMLQLDAQDRADVQVVFVTTDPARDTGPALRRYLDRFSDEPFTGLTGPLPQIVAAGKPMGVYVDKGQKLASGGYEVVHSDYLYGASGTDVRLIWDRTVSPADLAADIIKLLKS